MWRRASEGTALWPDSAKPSIHLQEWWQASGPPLVALATDEVHH